MIRKTLEGYLYEEFIYCFCGCGLSRPKYDKQGKERNFILGHVSKISNIGRVYSENTRRKISQANKGRSPPNKGKSNGYIDGNGYNNVKCPPEFQHLAKKNGFVREHRLIWQQNNQDIKLTLEVDIHHRDKNKLNNNYLNLYNFEHGEHSQLHRLKKI